jgi:hypothetical protein
MPYGDGLQRGEAVERLEALFPAMAAVLLSEDGLVV